MVEFTRHGARLNSQAWRPARRRKGNGRAARQPIGHHFRVSEAMLTIRQEQQQAFERAALQRFEDDMVEHLQGFAPKLCEIRGEPCVRQVIRLGMARAGQYGFTNRGPVRFYIELMFTLGCDFDTDLQYPWAGEILKDPELVHQTARAERLHTGVAHYLEHVAGPKKNYTLDALRRVKHAKLEDAQMLPGDFGSRVLEGLRTTHPQKCSYVGDPNLRKLVRRGIEVAGTYGITSELGIAVLVGLMFGFGHGVTADPLYPWVASTLSDRLVNDPNGRAERLYTKTRIYVDHLLAYMESEQSHV